MRGSGVSGPDSRNKSPIFSDVFGNFVGVKLDSGVEISKANDENKVNKIMNKVNKCMK